MPRKPLFCSFILLICVTCAYAQPSDEKKPADSSETAKATKPPVEEKLPIKIVLVSGSSFAIDEVSESSDGFWYKRGNVTTFIDRDRVARIEQPKPPTESVDAEEPAQRPGRWSLAEAARVKEFFQSKFNKPLPLSSFGQSDLHTRWGWDHRNGMDVNLHPDSVEGRALVAFLKAESIPFLAFRGPIPGVSTGPHIHVGNRSPRSYGR